MAVRGNVVFEVGDVDERLVTVALPRDRHTEHSWPWETLTVGAADNLPTPDVFECYIDQADDSGVLGPIHLPMCLHTPGARIIRVHPAAAVTAETRIFANTYLADHRGFRSFAQWSKVCALNEIVPLPAGVRAVGSLDPAQWVYLDRTGAVLTAALDASHDRPALAVSAQAIAAGVLTFYY